MRVAVTGATGLVGRALVRALRERGDDVVRVVRRDPEPGDCLWAPADGRIDAAALEGVHGVVHLAGSPVSVPWTPANRDRILSSRVNGTALLARTLVGLDRPPGVLVSGSAIGFYGPQGRDAVDENAPRGEGFLADVCAAWEAAAEPAVVAGLRVAFLRTGIVLSTEGGALAAMLPLFRKGLGGPVGGGRQGISWIGLSDEVGAILHILDGDLSGPVNGTAPEPASQRAFAKALGRALGRPAVLPAPGFAISLAMGEMGRAMVLEGAFVHPTALLDSGYVFREPGLDQALVSALRG